MAGNILGGFIGGNCHTAYYTATIGTTQTTINTTALYTTSSQISTDASRDDQGIRTFTISQVQNDGVLHAFLDSVAPAGGAGVPEDILLETGVLYPGASTAGTTLAFVTAGALIAGGTDDGKRFSYVGLCKISKASGAFNFTGNTYGKGNLIHTTTAITQNLVVPSAVLATAMVTAATLTILATTHAHGKVVTG